MYNRKRVAGAVIVLLAIIVTIGWLLLKPATATERTVKTATTGPQTKPPGIDKNLYSKDSPSSPWLVVNKRRPLNPKDYAPSLGTPNVPLRLDGTVPEMQLSTTIIPAVEQLFAAAKKDTMNLMLASGYRSYQQQITVYNAEVGRNGQQAADRQSARPGHSEHQTGMALDVEPTSRQCEVEACFGELPEGKWLAANAHKYGFVIRYMPGGEAITGYTYEPWHIRYVGKELAQEIHRQGNTALETYFGLNAAPDYQ